MARFRRGASAKRTIIGAAVRRPPVIPDDVDELLAYDQDGVHDRLRGNEDLSELTDDAEYGETLVVPLVTLPTLPTVRAPYAPARVDANDDDGQEDLDDSDEYDEYEADPSDEALFGRGTQGAPRFPPRRRATTQARALDRGRLPAPDKAKQLIPVSPAPPPLSTSGRGLSLTQQLKRLRSLDVMLVPGNTRPRRTHTLPHGLFGEAADRFAFLRAHRVLLVALTIVTVLSVTVTTAVSTGQVEAFLAGNPWQTSSGSGAAPTPTPRPAPDMLDAGHYVAKYGFDWPADTQPLPDDERQRMIFMLPAAYRAAAAYDQRYHQSMEPEFRRSGCPCQNKVWSVIPSKDGLCCIFNWQSLISKSFKVSN